jgi:hypothetical protein
MASRRLNVASLRQPRVAGQLVMHPLECLAVQPSRTVSASELPSARPVEPQRSGPLRPVTVERLRRDGVILAPARLERCGLCCAGPALACALELSLDLRPSAAERAQHLGRDPDDVSDAVAHPDSPTEASRVQPRVRRVSLAGARAV